MNLKNPIFKKSNKPEQMQSLDQEEEQHLLLETEDNVIFTVPKKLASTYSKFIENACLVDQNLSKIQLGVYSTHLKKIIEYWDHHGLQIPPSITKPLKSTKMEENTSKWDADYINIDDKLLFALLNTSNYLIIKPILELASAKIASEMKGKTKAQIVERFK